MKSTPRHSCYLKRRASSHGLIEGHRNAVRSLVRFYPCVFPCGDAFLAAVVHLSRSDEKSLVATDGGPTDRRNRCRDIRKSPRSFSFRLVLPSVFPPFTARYVCACALFLFLFSSLHLFGQRTSQLSLATRRKLTAISSRGKV